MDMNTNAGVSEDYIDVLESELLTATTSHKTYAKAATKAKNEHGLASVHYGELQGYCAQVATTYVMIADAYNYVSTLVEHAKNVSKNVGASLASLKIIARYLKCLCEDAETLKTRVRSLIETVEGIGDPVLMADSATLLKCLKELETEVIATVEAICTAIEAILVHFRCLVELSYEIGSAPEDGETTGLIDDLQQMQAVLCCEYRAGINPEIPPCPGDDLTNGALGRLAKCCPNSEEVSDRECDLTKPGIENYTFHQDIITAKENARKLADHKKCVAQFYEKESAGALAKMESVSKALEAATKAKELCK